MKKFVMTVASVLAFATAAPASAIHVVNNGAVIAASAAVRQPELSTAPVRMLLPTAQLSQLPEPEVFAMMLLGLVLIGYRTTRNSDEKFK